MHAECLGLRVRRAVSWQREVWPSMPPTRHHGERGEGTGGHGRPTGRVATWVAVDDNSIVGLAGLFGKPGESTVEPAVVARDQRRAGIGRSLLETAIDEARRRGATDVNIKPVARNASAIKAFDELGFRTLGRLRCA